MPKVSIITLSHNRPEYLREAVDSIKNQTMPDWEHIIIDDFSTDPKIMPLLREIRRDKRTKVSRTNYDADNMALLWNRGLDMATGEYVALLDDSSLLYQQ